MFNINKRLLLNLLKGQNIIKIIHCCKSTAKVNSITKVKPIISCKRAEYNFYTNQRLSKLEEVKLASKGWHHRKSKGDYFIIHMSDNTNTYNLETSFSNLGLADELIMNLKDQGIDHPTFIQSKAIPILLSGNNSLITAETGCGKTLAYLLPAIQQAIMYKSKVLTTTFNAPFCIILAPSRELAYQVEYIATSLVKGLDINTEVIVGGGTKRKMLNPSFKEIDILVATLGALSKLVTTGIFKVSQVKHVIIDEADTLLDDSFSEKLTHFLKKFPLQYSSDNTELFSGTQLTLVSATILKNLPNSVADIIVPESLSHVSTERLHQILPLVPQRFLRLGKSMKAPQLLQMVKADSEKQYPVMIFSNKSATCDWISMFLSENGVACTNLNGDMALQIRKDRFLRFQRGDVNVLSCSDLGSRGLDTTRVKHVINYDFPVYLADYVHRCGRTGRIGSPTNCHITNFITTFNEVNLVQKIELAVRKAETIPDVDGNISGIIKKRLLQNI